MTACDDPTGEATLLGVQPVKRQVCQAVRCGFAIGIRLRLTDARQLYGWHGASYVIFFSRNEQVESVGHINAGQVVLMANVI